MEAIHSCGELLSKSHRQHLQIEALQELHHHKCMRCSSILSMQEHQLELVRYLHFLDKFRLTEDLELLDLRKFEAEEQIPSSKGKQHSLT